MVIEAIKADIKEPMQVIRDKLEDFGKMVLLPKRRRISLMK